MKPTAGHRAGLAVTGLAVTGLALAGLALAGCANGASGGSAGAPAMHRAAPPNGAAKAGTGSSGQPRSGAGSRVRLAASGEVVYTATLTVRVANVTTADGAAKNIVTGAAGYVSGENLSIDHSRPARSTASLQLQIPADPYSSYSDVLDRLAALGTKVSQRQQARDVTGDVADVSSRVASDQSAIAQLRALLGRASSVSDVLDIQGQISQQESDLESMQARQRALRHEVSYATVSLYLTTSPPPAKRPAHRRGHSSGFTGGLSGGWHALRVAATALFTGLGAVLPFAVLAAAVGYLAYRARRVLARRRARAAE